MFLFLPEKGEGVPKLAGVFTPSLLFKAIFHSSRIIHSICTHPCADVRMGEDLQFTKQSAEISLAAN